MPGLATPKAQAKSVPTLPWVPAPTMVANRVDGLAGKFRFALIGKFRRRPPLSVLQNFLNRLGFSGGFTVGELFSNSFLINFERDEDYQRFFYRKIWTLGKDTMYVTKWSPNLRQDEDSPVVPVWISFPHLPIHLHEQRALFNIASMLGTPLKVDQATLNFTRPKYARVCVEVDVSKPLHQRIHIKHVDEDLFFQVQYEDPPVFCNSCRKLGHNLHSCKLEKPMVREPLKDQEIHKVHDKNPAAVLDGWTTVQRKGKAPVNPPARRENRREDTSNKVPQKTWVPKPIIDYSQPETSKRGEHRGPTFIPSTTTLFLEPSGLVHSHLPLHAEVHEAVPVANSESTAIQPIPLEDTSEADIPLEDTSEEDIPLKMTSSSAPPSPKAKSHTSKVCTRSGFKKSGNGILLSL
ncbi:hypothetical protein DM860_011136 [Cuscuta australis]|uniref:DUF4283 domain-containing protein n=1 Tax=Cuscuta australis TaxID=267555 RepID=A0A328DDB5_9ASTE|nr:hypothetical protein DM860_011136 [Cuscuta australis]